MTFSNSPSRFLISVRSKAHFCEPPPGSPKARAREINGDRLECRNPPPTLTWSNERRTTASQSPSNKATLLFAVRRKGGKGKNGEKETSPDGRRWSKGEAKKRREEGLKYRGTTEKWQQRERRKRERSGKEVYFVIVETSEVGQGEAAAAGRREDRLDMLIGVAASFLFISSRVVCHFSLVFEPISTSSS
ncbi:hypothetical protein L596_027392 [Steinernema carpocapsae]|uniref:Uncharacterized protein n=1 Tax=Steinernema carpocapsae TaxID=34508 RepID=A0A4U5M475_STECR|nr:hypothetical protein L596_027392 [Steinernema carpocapsae]